MLCDTYLRQQESCGRATPPEVRERLPITKRPRDLVEPIVKGLVMSCWSVYAVDCQRSFYKGTKLGMFP
ncbi:hypothetical protein J6590_016851 [Homalodisca vitripennis]|nr:hypothetical protein J6590_016851 [Homalodisca vitripennis]